MLSSKSLIKVKILKDDLGGNWSKGNKKRLGYAMSITRVMRGSEGRSRRDLPLSCTYLNVGFSGGSQFH